MRCGSVGPTALEGLEDQIPHGADIGFDALQPVGVGLAVLGALLVETVALGGQFVLEGSTASLAKALRVTVAAMARLIVASFGP